MFGPWFSMRINVMALVIRCQRMLSLVGMTMHLRIVRYLSVTRIFTLAIGTVIGIFHWRVPGSVRDNRTQILTPTEHFLPPVAMTVEMTMASSVRSDRPDVCVSSNEHDVGVSGDRNIGVVGLGHYLFRDDGTCGNDRVRRRSGDNSSGSLGIYNRPDIALGLASCHAP